jgi:tetratricopeptide (TPR) repeat protein
MAKTQEAPAAESRPTWSARLLALAPAWARDWKVASGLSLVAAVAVIGVLMGLTLLFGGRRKTGHEFLLPKALTRLDDGNLAEARQVATELRSLPDATFAERGGAMFVLGSVLVREAQQQDNPAQRRILYLVASRYLEQARSHGFPQGRDEEGLLNLGRCLHHCGRYGQSVPILREALSANPHARAELHFLLAESCLNLDPPKVSDALEQAALYLALQDLSAAERAAGWLLEGRILLAKGDTAVADAVLAQVPSDSPRGADVVMLRARIAIEAARRTRFQSPELPEDINSALAATINTLRSLEGRSGIDRELVPQAQLLIGQCYEQLGDRRAAIGQYDRLRRARFNRPDGMAATFFLADLACQEGRAAEAVEHFRRAIQQAGPRDTYQNPWLSLQELESRLENAAQELVAKDHFSEAVELAQAMPPLVALPVALRQQIAAHSAWGRQLLAQAAAQPAAKADITRAQARSHFRQAGAQGQRLAALSVATRSYVGDLATAAEHYQLGQGYRQAVEVWRAFLRQNPPNRRPEAMVGLGEALLALGETDAALAMLRTCREDFPTHPATYRARLLESYGLQEREELAQARELLVDNLYRHALTPKSSDWRDSLYALGELLYRAACAEETKSRLAGVDQADPEQIKTGLKLLEQSYTTFQEAIRTLSEAVARYPAADQAIQARFLIAESYRHSALWPRKKLAVTNIETSRLALNRQIQLELDEAVEGYQKLLAELSDEQRLARRTPAELAMLRNCYFGRADALFDLGRYEEAIQAYSAATNRYQHDPESLEAYVQIATCYRRLNRTNEARGTVEQARAVLARIRPDADFLRTTRLDRQQWGDLLTWLRTL